MKISSSLIVFMFLFYGCTVNESNNKQSEGFTKLHSSVTGINFINTNTESPEANILNYEYFYNGGGVAIGDINNDGLSDIFFTANQDGNKLYLNKGNFQFEDITQEAGLGNKSGWRTGVAMADVNGDGFLDIYVCRSGWQHPVYRVNALYINNKNLTFSDQAKAYGLADDSFSTQAAFLDFDKDGDLDMFLLNHSRLTISNAYDISKRSKTERIKYVGNKFYRNDNGKFKDASDSLGISGPASNYGLGIVAGDFNNDNWQDLFVSNDYTEKDKLYLNGKGRGFLDKSDSAFTHISQFSMGVDAADINNDGWEDLISIDMLPADNKRQKEFHWPERYDVYATMFSNGLHHQYMRNMLQLNNADGTFSEIGQFAGISNTDWSWAALFADYDNDGLQDLFISNGFKRNFTSNDFLKYGADQALKAQQGHRLGELNEVLEKIPSNKVHAYLFRNSSGTTFEDQSIAWGLGAETLANGAAYADLDNDGDLDLVTNNIDEEAGIYRNDLPTKNYLKVKLEGIGQNTFGIGARVKLYAKGKMMMRTLQAQRGFQSSVEPILHFGLGDWKTIDSLSVQWQTGEVEIKQNVTANQLLVLHQKDAIRRKLLIERPAPLFKEVKDQISFHHQENAFIDFKVQSLLPRFYSQEGPALAAGDVDGDNLEDLYFGGAKGQAGKLLIQQKNGSFKEKVVADVVRDVQSEDVDAAFFDMDQDGDKDLYVVAGGYEYAVDDALLEDRLYRNDGEGNFKIVSLPVSRENGSVVRPADFDGDGDQDLFIGGSVRPGRYPEVSSSVLLLNDGHGVFEVSAQEFKTDGIITDAIWLDVNGDKNLDLLTVGEWMAPTLYVNKDHTLTDLTSQYFASSLNGWWSSIAAADFDEDGDLDLLAGNFGLNNQFKPSGDRPTTLYSADYDDNGSVDPLMNYFIGDKSYPSATRDELTEQLPSFKKRYTDYQSYTTATIENILTPDELKRSKVRHCETFRTSYFENEGGRFVERQLPSEFQWAPVCALHVVDADGDGNLDVIAAGNLSGGRARFGKATANFGSLFLGDGRGRFRFVTMRESGFQIHGDVKKIVQIGKQFIFGINNKQPMVYELK